MGLSPKRNTTRNESKYLEICNLLKISATVNNDMFQKKNAIPKNFPNAVADQKIFCHLNWLNFSGIDAIKTLRPH